ncbi:MAG TPA: hypothetical protein VH062_24150 [Polyangiaceae bacterium]|jgi:hypothetical protein|nr:hypothetical protein [Polyangiaceae bacterium]
MKKSALLIGTRRYDDDSFARLQAPGVDVKAFAAVLSSPNIGGFDSVSTLVDRPFDEVTRAVSTFFGAAGREDSARLHLGSRHARRARSPLLLPQQHEEDGHITVDELYALARALSIRTFCL